MEFDQLSNGAIGCAIEAHKTQGHTVLRIELEEVLNQGLERTGVPPAVQH